MEQNSGVKIKTRLSRKIDQLMKNRMAVCGAFIILFVFVVALFAPLIAPYPPDQITIQDKLQPPSTAHFIGTDSLGRDVLSRMIWGARISLWVGFIAIGIALLIGVTVGAIAGFYSGWIDIILMRFVDIMLTIPTFFLILAVIAVLEPSLQNIMVIVGLTGWMGIARLVRAQFLAIKEMEYVLAARALGASHSRLIVRHILPNALSPVYVSAVFGVAGAILAESGLSFLGLGVQPPQASWGTILSEGKNTLEIAWWLSVFPGMAIFITVLGFNLLGEGLRDLFDTRLSA